MRSKYRFVALILLFIVSLSNNQLILTESNSVRTYWPTEEWISQATEGKITLTDRTDYARYETWLNLPEAF